MSEKHEVFAISELEVISFRCPKCKTEVFFHLTTPPEFGAPYICPCCRESYTHMGNLLAQYRELFTRAVSHAKEMNICLRVKVAGGGGTI